jgi:iduronate 2-sulfatase
MGEKDYLYKNSLWEESTRVPLLVRVPGLTRPNSQVEHPVSLIDVYPTLVDLCGISAQTAKNEKGHPLDGFSMRPLLENPAARTWNRPAVLTVVFAGEAYKNDPSMQHYAIRTERYRYILYNTGGEELYDHESDPYEWHNLAGLQRDPLRQMRRMLQEMVSPHQLDAFKRLR